MQQECNPVWQQCSPATSTSTLAPPKLDSVIHSVKGFISSQSNACNSGYPIWILFIIWLTTETGVTIIDWLIHNISVRRIMDIPDFIHRLPPTGKLILLALLTIQHLIYYIISICTIVRNIHRERRHETVPMDPYEQV